MDTLEKGSKGPEVKQLQERLMGLGYKPGSADGIFGVATEVAVKDFQKKMGLKADGVVGPITSSTLYTCN